MMMDVSSGDGDNNSDNNSDNDEGMTNTSNNKRSYHDAVGNSGNSNNDNDNDNDNEAKTTTALMTNLTTMSAAEQKMLSSTDLGGDLRRDQFRFHHLLPEMIKRLSKYLEPKDAVALGATSKHLRTTLSLSRLRPRTLIKSQGYATMMKKEGGGDRDKPRKAFDIPSYKKANMNIHTLKMLFSWRVGIDLHTFQLGPAQQLEAKIWIIGRRTSSTATTAHHNAMFPGVGNARVVDESPPLKNTEITAMFMAQESQRLSINFVPLDGEVYEFWYRLSASASGTDPVILCLNNIQTEYLIFDNEEMLFGTSYETLLTNGVLKAWDMKAEPGEKYVMSESFVANLLLATCRSLRMKMLLRNKTTNNNNEGEDEPVIDDIMASFFDQCNIMKTPASLQVVEDIVQAEIDERRVFQRIALEKVGQNGQPQRQQQQQPNLGGGGIAIGGGIRIQIDHQNGGQVHQIHLGPDGQPGVHQIHLGPDGQPVAQAGAGVDGDNDNGQQQQPPQVFVHRMGGNPPGLFAAARAGGDGTEGLPGIFAAAAAAIGRNNGGGGDPQQQLRDAFGIGVDAGAAEQQQDENVNDQRNNAPDLRAGDDQNIEDNDPTNNANNNQDGGPAVHVETVNMDLDDDDDDAVDDNENPDGNGGDDGGRGGRRPPPAQQQQHRNGQDQNGGYYGMLHDFLGMDQPPEGANDAAQQQQQNRGGGGAAAAAAAEPPPPPPQNLPNQIPQQLQDALNQMQGQVPGLIGNIMNMVAQQQQPPPNPGNQGPNEEPQPEVHVVEMPPMAMGLEMLQQMMGGGMQGGGGVGGNIPFGFPNNNPNNNNNFNDDDIPEID